MQLILDCSELTPTCSSRVRMAKGLRVLNKRSHPSHAKRVYNGPNTSASYPGMEIQLRQDEDVHLVCSLRAYAQKGQTHIVSYTSFYCDDIDT